MASSWTGRRDAVPPPMRSRRVGGVLRWLHRWLGLTLGLVLAVMGTTGALMAFRPEIQAAMDVPRTAKTAARLPLDQVVAQLEREVEPGRMLRSLSWTPGAALIEARYGGEAGDATWLVDPATGERVARPWGDAAFWTIER